MRFLGNSPTGLTVLDSFFTFDDSFFIFDDSFLLNSRMANC